MTLSIRDVEMRKVNVLSLYWWFVNKYNVYMRIVEKEKC